tara:strand:+ start:1760 stop:2068 length:309 start_codon:yes stop_codon:yes gene_type:complete
MIGYAVSKNKVKIRLTEERWFHIIESHDNLSGLSDVALDAVNDPDEIVKGKDELIAVKRFKDKHIVALYKEATKDDGFIITAFLTSKIDKVKKKRKTIWKKH